MTKQELMEKLESAKCYYEACVEEWGILEEEYRQADEDCYTAEEVVIALQKQLDDWNPEEEGTNE